MQTSSILSKKKPEWATKSNKKNRKSIRYNKNTDHVSVSSDKQITRDYSKIIKPDTIQCIPNDIYKISEESVKYNPFPVLRRRIQNRVRNQVPKNRTSSLETWEYKYFKHLIDLRDIFVKGLEKLEITGVDLRSEFFFNTFSSFIKKNSSGEINPYIQELNDYEENIYHNYIIKLDLRNNY